MAQVGSAATGSPAPSVPLPKATVPTIKRWRCDVCKVQFFTDFNEAVAHEEVCQAALDRERNAQRQAQIHPETTANGAVSKGQNPAFAALITQDTLDPMEQTGDSNNFEPTATTAIAATSTKAAKDRDCSHCEGRNKPQLESDAQTPRKPPSPVITPTKAPATKPDPERSSEPKALSLRTTKKRKHLEVDPSSSKSVVTKKCAPDTTIATVQAIKESLSKTLTRWKKTSGMLSETEIAPVQNMLQRLDSLDVTLEVLQTTLIGKVVVKLKKSNTKQRHLELKANALLEKWKSIASAGSNGQKISPSSLPSKRQASKKKQTQSQQPQHSFFNPRSVAKPSSATAATNKSKAPKTTASSAVTNPFFAPRRKIPSPADAVLAESKSLKRKLPKAVVDVDLAVTCGGNEKDKSRNSATTRKRTAATSTEEAENLSPSTTKAIASIFQAKGSTLSSKQILAEQRRAELAARRENERKKEQERQAKRAALFRTNTQANTKHSHTNDTGTTNRPLSVCDDPEPGSRGTTRKKQQHVGNKPLPPAAPRFPVPNHVLGRPGNRGPGSSSKPSVTMLPPDHPFRTRAACDVIANTVIEEAQPKPSVWLSSPSALDTSDVVPATRFTRIQHALMETFSVAPSTANMKPGALSLLPWNETYGMEKDGLVGASSREIFRQLVEYIDHWRVARNDSLERAAERHRKLARGKKRSSRKSSAKRKHKQTKKRRHCRDEDDWLVDDDCDDDECYYNFDTEDYAMAPLCLLTGPSASGKTAMVHTVARHCGNCKVLEINTARARSGAALKHAIEEATQSNSSLDMLKSKNKTINDSGGANFFFASKTSGGSHKKARNKIVDSDGDSGDETEPPPDSNKSSVTIVLIDEVDILFDDAEGKGDAGFWSALGTLAKATKCPILLTANSCPPQLDRHLSGSLPCRRLFLEKPSPMECASKILQVCHQPGNALSIRSELRAKGPDAIHGQLAKIATSCGCDLRKLMHELQVFAASGADASSDRSSIMVGDNTIGDRQLEESTSVCRKKLPVPDWQPVLHSITPSKIAMNQHSVLMLRGKHFGSLRPEAFSVEARVRIGPHGNCLTHIVDDETMLVLCPPYNVVDEEKDCSTFCRRLLKRVLSVSISANIGPANGLSNRIVASEELVDGTRVYGTNPLTVEYEFTEDLPPPNSNENDADELASDVKPEDSEEVVFNIPDGNKPALKVREKLTVETEDVGLMQWKNAISEAESSRTSATTKVVQKKTSKEDLEMVARLDVLSQSAHNASDASFLEDFGEGLPYLSGACRGFAFDYTEDCALGSSGRAGGVDTLRMHEKSRPPREEKLFELGWNDNCYFHGDSETYMTLPHISQRRCKEKGHTNPYYCMNQFRGDEDAAGQLACSGMSNAATSNAISTEELENNFSVEDLDRFAHHQQQQESSPSCSGGASFAEDMYLPRGVSPAILDLPEILRKASSTSTNSLPSQSFWSIARDNQWLQSLETNRAECSQRLLSHAIEYFLPWGNDLAKWSYGRFGFANNKWDRTHMILECLPILRRIGMLETANEYAFLKAREESDATKRTSSRRRTTRTQCRARRHHYFDKISATLRRDEADRNSSEVGALLVGDSLVYSTTT